MDPAFPKTESIEFNVQLDHFFEIMCQLKYLECEHIGQILAEPWQYFAIFPQLPLNSPQNLFHI